MRSRFLILVSSAGLALAASQSAPAALPVIDVASIAKLAQQIQAMQAQLQVTQSQLLQAQDAYRSMTGARGMEQLLAGTVRNYLPPDWAQVAALAGGGGGPFAPVAGSVDALRQANAVLGAPAFGRLTREAQASLTRSRNQVALEQALFREALARTSSRFDALQRLIDALPRTTDPKAVMDLQARIEAEQAMLENEQTKLESLQASLAAERALDAAQRRERAIRDLGSLRTLPALGL